MTKQVIIAHVPYMHAGGEDRHVAMLRAVYERMGYECVFAPESRDPPGLDLVRAAKSLATDWRLNPDCVELDRRWASGQVSHLHAHNLFPVLGPSFLRWVIDRNVPLLMTVHNHRFFCANGLALRDGRVCKDCFQTTVAWRPALYDCNGSRPKSLYYAVGLTQIRSGDLMDRAVRRYIAPSPYIADELRRFGVMPEKVALLLNPVRMEEEGVFPSPEEALDYFYAGRLSEEKGLRHFVRVAASLPQRTFGIAGDGPLRGWLEASLPGIPNLRYLGMLDERQVARRIRATQVCALPSVCNEILPTFVLEAFLSGKKCLVPEMESTRWLARAPFWGQLADTTRPETLASALEEAFAAAPPPETQVLAARERFAPRAYEAGLSTVLKELEIRG